MQRVGGHFLVISPSHFKTSATNKNKKFYTLALLQIFTLYLPIFLNILVLYSSTVGTQVLLRVTAYLCIVVSCCVQECTQRYKKNVQNKLRAVFPEKIQDQLACNVILVSVWNQLYATSTKQQYQHEAQLLLDMFQILQGHSKDQYYQRIADIVRSSHQVHN